MTDGEASALRTVSFLRYGALGVLGGYGIALCYRTGLFRRLLPRKVNAAVERGVEAVKRHTEPLGDAACFARARRHLIKTYLWSSSGICAMVAGAGLFYATPYVPIVLPIATTVLPAILVAALPRRLLRPPVRLACFYLTWISVGYVMGPLAWVAQDSLVVLLLLTGCTFAGLCVPLFLTRGMISYVVSSQLLSCALALALVTTPTASRTVNGGGSVGGANAAQQLVRTLKEQQAVQIVLNSDVNVFLTMQLMSNLGINLLHTLPVIWRFVCGKESSEELAANADALQEAFYICAGWMFVVYRVVRGACRALVRKVLAEEVTTSEGSGGSHDGREVWGMFAHRTLDVNTSSSVLSGLVMVLLYVKAVSFLQRGDPQRTLGRLRTIALHLSPVTLLLGKHAIRRA